MICRAITLTLTVLLAQQALAQTGGRECRKQADCVANAICQMYDHFNYPQMWPVCEHLGFCVCSDGYVQVSNGSCVPIVNRNLGEACSNQVWERYRTPEQRCDGSKVICNTPTYVDRGQFCELAPVPTAAPVPIVTGVVVPTCTGVGFLAPCDSRPTGSCCAAGTGLTCQVRHTGNNASYSQCLCSVRTNIWDQGMNMCRPRVYGDICLTSDECGSGLISNTGFECRLGRCRCASGFEPHDNQFWNETSRTTYTRRICISSGAVSWVPTGQTCTMDPHLFAGLNSTRVCHPRAFCHLCWRQRQGYTVGQTTAVTGVCREMNCGSGSGNCGNQGRCNNWSNQIDPPCERGMCDCNWNQGYYKDRFSRCALYENLGLGDRCIVPDGTTQLHPWYPNNEDWDDDKVCVADGSRQGGYAGYNWGTVKCKLPLIEDADGNCVRNDDLQDQWMVYLGYNQECDDADTRLPLRRCDASKGLSCINRICQCPQTQTCSAGYGGCGTSGSTTPNLWDGGRCRARTVSDACNSSSDCCGGTCNNGVCGCAAGLTLVEYSVGVNIQNGDNKIINQITSNRYCFRNVSVVGKGQACQLDPVTWNCGTYRYALAQTFLPSLVCAPGLVCMRCPIDYSPDDETHGICRSVTAIPDTRPAPQRPCQPVNPGNPGNPGVPGGQPSAQWINGRWTTGWSSWRNSASSAFAQSFVVAFLAVCAAVVNF